MRVFIIGTSDMGPELQGGLIGVVGSVNASAEEKQECVATVSRYATEGWAITADPFTPIGWLAALTAEAACVPFVSANRLGVSETATLTQRSDWGTPPSANPMRHQAGRGGRQDCGY